jgi:hypothetical protein
MKQFPKLKGKQVDASAHIEFHIHSLIKQNSCFEGKQVHIVMTFTVDQESICMLLDSVVDKKDFWLIYELCPGRTLTDHLFDVKGEFFKSERVYMVHHGPLYRALRFNLSILK